MSLENSSLPSNLLPSGRVPSWSHATSLSSVCELRSSHLRSHRSTRLPSVRRGLRLLSSFVIRSILPWVTAALREVASELRAHVVQALQDHRQREEQKTVRPADLSGISRKICCNAGSAPGPTREHRARFFAHRSGCCVRRHQSLYKLRQQRFSNSLHRPSCTKRRPPAMPARVLGLSSVRRELVVSFACKNSPTQMKMSLRHSRRVSVPQ